MGGLLVRRDFINDLFRERLILGLLTVHVEFIVDHLDFVTGNTHHTFYQTSSILGGEKDHDLATLGIAPLQQLVR